MFSTLRLLADYYGFNDEIENKIEDFYTFTFKGMDFYVEDYGSELELISAFTTFLEQLADG
jgi:hypothetical protein